MNIEQDIDIAVIGLGYVGLTLSIALAEAGLKVTGFEKNKVIVDMTNQGVPHFKEKGIEVSLRRQVDQKFLFASNDLASLKKSTVFFITVGTPLNEAGEINLKSVILAAHQVGKIMPKNALIIFRSTMKVGVTRFIIKPIFESYNKEFFLAVCPERTLEGNALQELRSLPQIIGGFDDKSAERAAAIFRKITNKIVMVSSPETAEVMKLVDNTYRDVNFAFGNEVAKLCNEIEGVNSSEVIRLGKMGYERTNVALPGLVGGPCLSKDPHILSQSASEMGVIMEITNSARKINETMADQVVDFIIANVQTDKKLSITIAGFAFKGKPETDDLRGSISIKILNAFKTKLPDCKLKIFDPVVDVKVMKQYCMDCYSNFDKSIKKTDVLIICNNHEFFSSNNLQSMLKDNNRIKMVYDFWSNFDHLNESQKNKLNYVTYGTHWRFK